MQKRVYTACNAVIALILGKKNSLQKFKSSEKKSTMKEVLYFSKRQDSKISLATLTQESNN